MSLEAMQPVGRGEEQGEAAGPAPAASPARTDAGCNRRGCPSVARRFAARNERASPKARPTQGQLAGYSPLTEPPVAGPQFLPMFCITCCRYAGFHIVLPAAR